MNFGRSLGRGPRVDGAWVAGQGWCEMDPEAPSVRKKGDREPLLCGRDDA